TAAQAAGTTLTKKDLLGVASGMTAEQRTNLANANFANAIGTIMAINANASVNIAGFTKNDAFFIALNLTAEGWTNLGTAAGQGQIIADINALYTAAQAAGTTLTKKDLLGVAIGMTAE